MIPNPGALATTGISIDYEWPVGIYELNCTGDEATLWDCIYHTNDSVGLQCSQYNDASVSCMCKWSIIYFNSLSLFYFIILF